MAYLINKQKTDLFVTKSKKSSFNMKWGGGGGGGEGEGEGDGGGRGRICSIIKSKDFNDPPSRCH